MGKAPAPRKGPRRQRGGRKAPSAPRDTGTRRNAAGPAHGPSCFGPETQTSAAKASELLEAAAAPAGGGEGAPRGARSPHKGRRSEAAAHETRAGARARAACRSSGTRPSRADFSVNEHRALGGGSEARREAPSWWGTVQSPTRVAAELLPGATRLRGTLGRRGEAAHPGVAGAHVSQMRPRPGKYYLTTRSTEIYLRPRSDACPSPLRALPTRVRRRAIGPGEDRAQNVPRGSGAGTSPASTPRLWHRGELVPWLWKAERGPGAPRLPEEQVPQLLAPSSPAPALAQGQEVLGDLALGCPAPHAPAPKNRGGIRPAPGSPAFPCRER